MLSLILKLTLSITSIGSVLIGLYALKVGVDSDEVYLKLLLPTVGISIIGLSIAIFISLWWYPETWLYLPIT